MNDGAPRIYSPQETVRDRCRAMGMPTWRCTVDGTIIEEPVEPGVAGLWLRSGRVAQMIKQAADEWANDKQPKTKAAFPSCWLIPIPEEQRRRRTGMLVAMAMGPWALDSEAFGECCRSAGIDPQAARTTLLRLACFDEAGAKRVEQALRWTGRDLVSLTEHQHAVRGFTTELTHSYETIDLLYALGRSMLNLERPERFVTLVCDRLHEHMPFGWLAARFLADPKCAGPLASQTFIRGKAPCAPADLERALDAMARRGGDVHGFLAESRKDLGLDSDARAIIQPVTREGIVAGVIACGEKCGDDPQVSSYEMQLLEAAGGYTSAMLENATLYQQQQAMFMGTLRSLTAAIDAKDRYTCGHSERVALMAMRLASVAGLDDAQAERVHICGLVHDVGKIGVPEAVLCKPGRLTPEEFAIIKLHPEIGHRIIKDIPMLEDVLPGVLYHHERWDGKGYPHGIAGAEIPLFARLLALADTFDAMSSTRSYRAALPRPQVLAEIERNAGAQFDPDLAVRFVKLDFSEYDRMVERHARDQHTGVSAAA